MQNLPNKLRENLHSAIHAEHIASSCFGYIASLTKNGRVRAKFCTFAELAKNDKESLVGRLSNFGITNFILEDKCELCKLKPESFSLAGALNLGLELTSISLKFYNELLGASERLEDKNLFRELIKEKTEQKNFLKKEKRFVRPDKVTSDFISSYCIPEVAAKLWNK